MKRIFLPLCFFINQPLAQADFENFKANYNAKFEDFKAKRDSTYIAFLKANWLSFSEIPNVSLPPSTDSLKIKTVEIPKIQTDENPNIEIINALLKEGVNEEQSAKIALEIIDSLGIDAIKEGQILGIAIEPKNAENPTIVSYNISPSQILTLLKSEISGYKYVESKDSRDISKYKIPKNSKYRFPLDIRRKTSGFGMRNHPILKQPKHHNGVDYAAPKGTPVYAIADGVVIENLFTQINGNYVAIKHADNLISYYLHLDEKGIEKGTEVKTEQVIGKVGSTGRTTGPHLHLGIKKNGNWQDPEEILWTI